MKDYFKFWGKTDDKGNWHPLVCHMLDVAAVAQVWLENDPILLSIFTENMGLRGSIDENVIRLISFSSALHDIGKATICFQNKIPEFAKNAGIHDKNRAKIAFDHGLYGIYWISKYEKAKKMGKRSNSTKDLDEYYRSISGFSDVLRDWEINNLTDLVIALIKAGCWHHGTIYSSSQVNEGFQNESESSEVYPTVNKMRNDLLVAISGFFKISSLGVIKISDYNPALTRLFAGFVSVCDWIGSSDEVFRSDYSLNLEDHFQNSTDRSVTAIKKYGLVAQSVDKGCKNFSNFFGFSPRGVQSKIEEILQDTTKSF